MAAASDNIQTIARLTPLAEVLLTVDYEVKSVTPRAIDVAAAAGRVLATAAVTPVRPSTPMALQDGWRSPPTIRWAPAATHRCC